MRSALTSHGVWPFQARTTHHGSAHLHDFPTVQAQLLVVIQHSVHVFDPHRIHRAIENDPLAVWGGVCGTLPKELGQHPVLPLMADWIKLTIQLTHGNALGVHHMQLHSAPNIANLYHRSMHDVAAEQREERQGLTCIIH